MPEEGDAFLARAHESPAGAMSEYANERYNNAANRSYYACFQAAIFALARADIRPPGTKGQWTHAMVQSQFAGTLIQRRKAYPSSLQDTLFYLTRLRLAADSERTSVTAVQASRALHRAQTFVAALAQQGGTKS